MSALDDIAAERRRQVEEEGWTTEHDDQHDRGELARAAACYAAGHTFDHDVYPAFQTTVNMTAWPWSRDWWKPTTPRRNLVKAAALIVAEIERLDRAAPDAH